MMNKDDIVSQFINFIKKYDVPEKGKITASTIKRVVPYSKRHFDRIFKEYSKYTPLEIAERFRLLCCIESIKNGNTLKDTAYDYDYTPEGLSNLLRNKMNIDVKKIKAENFEFEKHMKISNLMTQLDEFKYQLRKDEFMMLLEGLDNEGILKTIAIQENILNVEDGFEIHLEFQKILDLIKLYNGIQIDRRTYENIDSQEAIVMLAILKSNGGESFKEFTLRETELISMFFLLNFFFNMSSLKLNKGYYKLSINQGIKEILEFLKEIENVTGDVFEVVLKSHFKNDKFIIEFNSLYKEMLLEFNRSTNL